MEGTMTRKVLVAGAVAAALAAAGIAAVRAQQPAPEVKRNIVLKQDMTIPGREAVMVEQETPPGAVEGLHTHPTAELFGFVVEGSIEFELEGKTTTLKAGDHFYVAPGKVHQVSNKSAALARTDVVFVAEKGKPLTVPVK
jgi:quercetin dioxygenase-like cupin family protein